MSNQPRPRNHETQRRKAIARLLDAVDKAVIAADEIRAARRELERLTREAAR